MEFPSDVLRKTKGAEMYVLQLKEKNNKIEPMETGVCWEEKSLHLLEHL